MIAALAAGIVPSISIGAAATGVVASRLWPWARKRKAEAPTKKLYSSPEAKMRAQKLAGQAPPSDPVLAKLRELALGRGEGLGRLHTIKESEYENSFRSLQSLDSERRQIPRAPDSGGAQGRINAHRR